MCESVEKRCNEFIAQNYPGAQINISAQQNIFEKIFEVSETPLVVEVNLMKEKEVPQVDRMTALVDELRKRWPDAGLSYPPLEDKIHLKTDPDKLLLYEIP